MSATPVTDSVRVAIRNAGIGPDHPDAKVRMRFHDGATIFAMPCPGCPGVLSYLSRGGRVNRFSYHCTTCHSFSHNACEACGKCLPDTRKIRGWTFRARSDALHCSNACRQRAYRARKAAA